MRVLVCGGRDFNDYHWLCDVLDKIHKKTPITCIIEGGASGADKMASWWPQFWNYAIPSEEKIEVEEYPAKWEEYGKAAGSIRNKQMLDEGKPDLVIAFPGGEGTKHMVGLTKWYKIPLIQPIKSVFDVDE